MQFMFTGRLVSSLQIIDRSVLSTLCLGHVVSAICRWHGHNQALHTHLTYVTSAELLRTTIRTQHTVVTST